MRHLPVLASAIAVLGLAAPAWAGEAVLSADRPGLGESTGTPGVGFFNVEGGVAVSIAGNTAAPGTSGLTVRFGVDDNVEIRALLPDLVLSDGALVLGPLGVGAKIAGRASERFTVSAVPQLLIDLDGAAGWQLSANGALEVGRFVLWLNATTSVLEGVSVLGGGGASVSIDSGGLYVNAGREVVVGQTLVGGGGWWGLGDGAQIDAGVDLWLDGAQVVAVPTVGASLAF